MAPLKSVSGINVSTFEWIIVLLLGAVALSALARRIKVPYPTFLAIGGALIAFVPSSPSWTLDPDLALALFVAPVLLDAAFDTSLRDLRNNWVPVATLVVAAVGLTTAARGLRRAPAGARTCPGPPRLRSAPSSRRRMPPPRPRSCSQVKLPHRMVKILEGESLLNDATRAADLPHRGRRGRHASIWHGAEVAPTIALALVGSVVGGLCSLARIMPLIMDA